jgi:glycosyltransferase involved in cell wall biosynthesis
MEIPRVSVILPCRNEEKTVGLCIRKIKESFRKNRIDGEIIVSDSSTDRSAKIAGDLGAKVISHGRKGYGIACLEAFKAAQGEYIIIGDADNTYDFSQIPGFIRALDEGYDLVVGSRLKGRMDKGAMPALHKHIGNPLLSGLLNYMFGLHISDAHSGFRAIRREALDRLNLKTTGMEFASEMLILAGKTGLRIKEIPISYAKRIGKSKLSSFSDGWRHLRFMLLYSPTHLFLIPGLVFFIIGFSLMVPFLFGTLVIRGISMGLPLMFLGSLISILGYQVITLGLYAKIYAIHTGFEKNDKLIDFIASKLPLERGISLGSGIISAGALFVGILLYLVFTGRIILSGPNFLLFSMTLLVIGFQTLFSAFFLSIMLIEKKE